MKIERVGYFETSVLLYRARRRDHWDELKCDTRAVFRIRFWNDVQDPVDTPGSLEAVIHGMMNLTQAMVSSLQEGLERKSIKHTSERSGLYTFFRY
jgi:hypothetical protein